MRGETATERLVRVAKFLIGLWKSSRIVLSGCRQACTCRCFCFNPVCLAIFDIGFCPAKLVCLCFVIGALEPIEI